MNQIGQQLADVVRSTTSRLLVVAPFIKVYAMRRMLEFLKTPPPNLQVVTRWRAEEVLAGVSDLEVFDVVAEFGGELWLCPALHAKYYRGDSRVLVGSANVTFKALGLAPSPNLEILVAQDPTAPDISQFEQSLFDQAFRATALIRAEVQKQVAELKAVLPVNAMQFVAKADEDHQSWLPLCVRPDLLYKIYTGAHSEMLLASTLAAATADLKALGVLPGMSEEAFTEFASQTIRRQMIVRRVDELLQEGNLAEERALALIRELHPRMSEGYDAGAYWTILKAWLTYFFPTTYRTRAASEVLERSRLIYGREV
jgi:hypothetical protein